MQLTRTLSEYDKAIYDELFPIQDSLSRKRHFDSQFLSCEKFKNVFNIRLVHSYILGFYIGRILGTIP